MAYSTILKPSDYFNTTLWTGDGNSTQNVTGTGFNSDFTWNKGRSGSGDHQLYDKVRGVQKMIISNSSNAESTNSIGLTAWSSDGFTVGSDMTGNGSTFVSWNWKANGAGSSNTDGTINTTATSVNTTAGFSISTYSGNGSSGATIGHGLGAVPQVMIVKNTYQAANWFVYHSTQGATKYLQLNTTAAVDTASSVWNNTAPTSSVFSVGNSADVNQAGGTFVAYCFAEKQGFSKFGQYTGNGNASDPPFIYTGFKPNFVMVKKYNGTQSWVMTDLVRDNAVGGGGNGIGARLQAQSSAAEDSNDTWAAINKFSNGFQPIYNDDVTNGSGSTYIFMAFAAAPLVGTNDIPANAR